MVKESICEEEEEDEEEDELLMECGDELLGSIEQQFSQTAVPQGSCADRLSMVPTQYEEMI